MAKYTRRAFLRHGVRAGGGAVIGGAIGAGVNELKKMYNVGLKQAGQTLADLDDAIEKSEKIWMRPVQGMQELEKERISVYDRLFGRTEEDKRKWREEHNIKTEEDRRRQEYETRQREAQGEIARLKQKSAELHRQYKMLGGESEGKETRRSFLGRVTGYGWKHPIASGAVIGAAYKTIKDAPRLASEVITARKNAKKDDEINKLRAQVTELEAYKAETNRMGTEIARLQDQYNSFLDHLDKKYSPTPRELREATGSTRSVYAHRRGLESTINNHKHRRPVALFLGLFMILFSMGMQPALTGFAVSSGQSTKIVWTGITLFLCGLAIIFLELIARDNLRKY